MTIWEAQIGLRYFVEVGNNVLPALETEARREFLRLTGRESEFVFTEFVGELSTIRKLQELAGGPVTSFRVKIGVKGHANVPDGGDFPMRMALGAAFRVAVGIPHDYMYSGWNARLTEEEQKRLENK